MLPPFDDRGYLPPGIHKCRIDEAVQRFGHGSPERSVEIRELQELTDWARHAGVLRLIINGSFVTSKQAPNDVDVVILAGTTYPRDQQSIDPEGERRWPFLQVFLAADDQDLELWATRDFGTDRVGHPKGVVEIIL